MTLSNSQVVCKDKWIHLLRVDSRNYFSGCAVVSVFWLWRERVFGLTSVIEVQYMMARRNRYFEAMEDGQMTPRGYPNFNSYIKNLLFCIPDRQRNYSRGRLGNYVPPG
jgi:hypothetical protein